MNRTFLFFVFIISCSLLFANKTDDIIEKILKDAKKSSEQILKENNNSTIEETKNSSTFLIRSEEYSKSKLGFSWYFSDGICATIYYNFKYNKRQYDEMITKLSRFGKPIKTHENIVVIMDLDQGIIITTSVRENIVSIEIMISTDSKIRL